MQTAEELETNFLGVQQISVYDIDIKGGTQTRERYDQGTLDDYKEAWLAGARFPEIVVFCDNEGRHWLADGFHRLLSARASKAVETISAEVYSGDRRDALLYALGANQEHGLKRSNADKRKAVMTMMADPEWVQWSNRAIAEVCKVSDVFVGKLRGEVEPVTANVCSDKPEVQAKVEAVTAAGGTPRIRTDKHGNTGVMDVAPIAKATTERKVEPVEEEEEIEAVAYRFMGGVYDVAEGAGGAFHFIRCTRPNREPTRARGDEISGTYPDRKRAQLALDEWAFNERCLKVDPAQEAAGEVELDRDDIRSLGHEFTSRDKSAIEALLGVVIDFGPTLQQPVFRDVLAAINTLDGLRR